MFIGQAMGSACRWRAVGLFSRKSKKTVDHPGVERVVHVPASTGSVIRHLDRYSDLFSPKHAQEHSLFVAASGEWSSIRLPDNVHPWQLHNLAFWMLDCPDLTGDVVAFSGPGLHHAGYRLIRDPEVSDALCGWDDDGVGLTVYVPSNDVVRGEDVPVPRAISVPSADGEGVEVRVLLEDPGHAMNPTNAATVERRVELDLSDAAAWSTTW